jgi:hypothetical protein
VLTKIFIIINIFTLIYVFLTLLCPGFPVKDTYQAGLSSPTCPRLSCPSCLVPDFCHRCPVADVLTLPGCPVPAVLFQLPSSGNFVNSSPDSAVISWQIVPSVLSRLPCPADLSGRPVQSEQSRLSCPGYPLLLSVLAVLSERPCPRYPISTATVFPFRLSCPKCPVLAVMS